jgi:fido (protein-threonine AMPylation protein)
MQCETQNPSLTKNAVKILLNPKPSSPGGSTSVTARNTIHNQIEEPLFVKILKVKPNPAAYTAVVRNFQPCQIFDGEFETEALVYITNGNDIDAARRGRGTGTRPCIIKVNGYVTSEANYNKIGPGTPTSFLCITSFETVASEPSGSVHNLNSTIFIPPPKRIIGGNAGSFFQEVISCFTDEELCGLSVSGAFASGSQLDPSIAEKISLFLTNYHAMRTLSQMTVTVTETPQQENADKSTRCNYIKAVKEFSESQLQLQIASLTKNAGKHDAEGASTLVQRYSSALSMALSHARDPRQQHLTIGILCEWHRELGGGGLIANAGRIRDKQVKAGITTFTHKDHVREELEKLILVLGELEVRAGAYSSSGGGAGGGALNGNGNRNVNLQQAYGSAVFAAAALFGICDIHPFDDGNGRLARIVSNWALARTGFPFVINFFASLFQRTEYINAIQKTSRNIQLVCFGNVSVDVFSTIRRLIGPLKPLVDLTLDRVHKAVVECKKIIAEKSRLESEEMEASAAKKFRDTAAAGCCLICMDINPNIATLCCGKAVHISCIATWLSQKLECPHCRVSFPSMPEREPRPRSPVQDDAQDTMSTFSTDEEEGSTFSIEYIPEEDSTSVIEVDEPAEHIPAEPADSNTDDHDAGSVFDELDDTTMDDHDAGNVFDVPDDTSSNDNTSSDDDTDDTYPQDESPQRPAQLRCSYSSCRNLAANKCGNDACGSCCQMFGQYRCARHNV